MSVIFPLRDPSLVGVVDATSPIRSPAAPDTLRFGYGVRLVRTDEQLEEICRLRTAAYSRRLPDMAAMLARPEPEDTAPGTFIFLATRLADGAAVGTCRLHTNVHSPIEFETNVDLPQRFSGRLLAQGMRLAVVADNDTILVTKLLLKAVHQFCLGFQVAHVLVAAEPPRDRFYRAFGFREIYPNRRYLFSSAPNHECALLTFEFSRSSELLASNPGHVRFFLESYCPDIQIFASLFASWERPRRLSSK